MTFKIEAAQRLTVTAAKMIEFTWAGKPGRYYPDEEFANWAGKGYEWRNMSKGMQEAIRKADMNK